MIRGNNRTKILVISKCHVVLVHHIAQLTFFGNRLLVRCSLMNMIFYQVLVGIYHYLSGSKKSQDYPGVNDMLLIPFQNGDVKGIINNDAFLQK